ncbi:uncharacterized protein [Hetaerina americana]|uniref:uncharacterized protein n=1 Tax=Hetaerina americana TaxID=62018 RepID=UPI003A7F2841
MGKYSTYTAAFKLKVIAYAEEYGIRAAGREYCVAEFNVRYWSKQKDALLRAKMSTKAFRGPKTGRFPEIEEELLVYVRRMRNCGGVSNDMMLSRAREIARRHGIDGTQFKVSRGWLCGFMRRHGLVLRRGQFSGLETTVERGGQGDAADAGGTAGLRVSSRPTSQGRMLVMETEQHAKEESSSSTKGTPSIKSALAEEEAELEAAIVEEEEVEVEEEEVEEEVEEVVEEDEEEVLLGGEEEEKLLAAGSEWEEGITLPDEGLEVCVVKEVVDEPSTPPGLSASELVAEIEEEEEEEEEGVEYEEGERLRTGEDFAKGDDGGNMLVEVAAGHGVEGAGGVGGGGCGVMGKEGVAEAKKDMVVVAMESQEKESLSQAEVKDLDRVVAGSEENGGVGRTKDGLKDGSPVKVAGQLGGKESADESSEKKNNSQSKETLSSSKVKKEPKEVTESPPKTVPTVGCKGTAIAVDQEDFSPSVVKLEPQEETEEGANKQGRGIKGEVDSSNPASDDYEEEGHEDGTEETPEEECHGEKRSCLGDSGGLSSEESGDVCCKRRRVEGSTDVGGGMVSGDGATRGGGGHHGGEGGEVGGDELKECMLTGDSEKEGVGGSDESLDRKMERLKKEIHMLGVMAKQKELEWDEIIRAKKSKEENLIRLRRRRRIAAISREAALAERRRHRREGRRARTEADLSSEEEGTDEEWYMQIRGMTGGALPGSRVHVGGGSGSRQSPGRATMRNTQGTQGSYMMGLNSSTLPHSTVAQSLPLSTSSIPSIVSTTYIQRMHRPILPKPPTIPGGTMNRRNMMQQSNPVSVAASIANPLIPATVPSNGGLSGNGCGSLDGSKNVNQVIGEGRQGPILDVRSIIADYRSRHPETVPLRGRRNKSLTPSPAAASSLGEGGPTGGAGSDGGPSDNPAATDAGMSTVTSTPGILNIASLALGSGSQVRTRGIQPQDGSTPDISYLLLSAGNGCTPGGTLPIRHQQPTRESSRPSSTESSRSGGQAVPPINLPTGGTLVDSSGNFSFKDVLVQFARMSQTEQQQQMMAVIPGMGGQGLLSSAPPLQPQAPVQSRQPRHILPSTTTTSVLPGPLVTPARPPPPPYPEVTLLPVLVAGNEVPSVRPIVPPEVPTPQPRSTLPPPTPSLLQMSLSAPTSTPQATSPPSTSLLHGILTKSGTGLASSSGLGSSSSSGPSPRATAFAPTLARLLTAPEKQPSLASVRPAPPVTTGSSVLGSQAFVSIGELLQTSKAKNEITITPVSGAQSSVLKQQQQLQQQQPIINRSAKEEPAAHMEEEQDDSTDRLVIDESLAASEGDGRRQSRQRPAPLATAPAGMAPEVQEGMADEEEVEEEEVAMEEEDGDGMDEEEGAMDDEEDEGEEGPVPECQGCHSRAAQFVCAGCGNQWYCSRDCQVSAWDEHSEVCSG